MLIFLVKLIRSFSSLANTQSHTLQVNCVTLSPKIIKNKDRLTAKN